MVRAKDMVVEKDRKADDKAVDKKIKQAKSDFKKAKDAKKAKEKHEKRMEEITEKGLTKVKDAKEKAEYEADMKKDIKEIKKMSLEYNRTAHEANIADQTERTLKGKLAKSIGLHLDKKVAEVKADDPKPKPADEKKYTQKEYDQAVHMAAGHSAKLAIKYADEMRAKNQVAYDKTVKGLEEAVKDQNKKVDESPTVKLKYEISKSVMEAEGVDSLKPDTGTAGDDGSAALRKNKSALFRAIDGVTSNPKDNGLNAAATSGVAIARSVLDRSSIDQEAVK